MNKLNIKIAYLGDYPEVIPVIGGIWREALGKIWMPGIGIEEIESLYYTELNSDALPLTYIALYNETPVGSCTLQLNDGIRPDLKPWLSDLVVDPQYQKQGIGKMLVAAAIKKAKQLHFKKLYLFTFDPSVSPYYETLGWKKMGTDEFNSHPVIVMERVL